jgi:hypothetical protein
MFKKFVSSILLALLIAIPVFGQDLKTKILPFNGKLITSDDPTQIGTNFQTLQNLRYTDSHVKGIGGMTKINSSPLAKYLHARNAFHFNKNNPSESHVLFHAFNSSGSSPVVIQTTASIPGTGSIDEASPVAILTSTSPGYFATVPGDNVIFANGDITYIWGGNEAPISAFLTSSSPVVASVTNSNDYTEILNNTSQASDQTATLLYAGGNDSYAKLLLHFDGTDGATTITDSSASGHSASSITGFTTSVTQKEFGVTSGRFAGTGSVIWDDHADWTLGTADWTIDFWIMFDDVTTAQQQIFSQKANPATASTIELQWQGGVNNRWQVGINSTAYNYSDTPANNTWYHVAVVKSGGNILVYRDGVSKGSNADATSINNDGFKLGASPAGNYPFTGYIDEFRLSAGIARWTGNFTVPTQAYGNGSNIFLIGSKRPLQGFKFYVFSGNTVASTLTVKEWQGSSWTTLSITDNTDTGATLAQTGTVTWTATGSAKARYINGLSLYWYQVSFDAGSVSIYNVTVNAPMQQITNIWDGTEQLPIRTLKYDGTTNKDYSVEVADNYQDTYADFSSLNTSHYIYVGFTEPQQALDITFVAGSENGTASTTMSVTYWNGSTWVSVTALDDGTATSTTSFSKGGVISWQGASLGTEFQRTISNETPLFYYRISFAAQLDADVKVSEIRGVPYPQAILSYSYPAMYQSRAILLNESSRYKNKLLYSAFGTADVFVGDDTGSILVGDSSEITGACTLSLVLTSALEQLIITKKNQTYRLFGNGPENWELQLISGTVGCIAPKTIQTVSLPLDSQSNFIGRHIAIWQGADGIYVTDGRTPSPIHNDIKNLFDKRSSTSINTLMIDKSVGFIDHENLEYHWLFASGSSETLDKEYVFDLRRWKWFEVVRGSGKQLQTGFKVTDAYGNNYNYGTLDTGYAERLEYGNSFDTDNIIHTVQFGDVVLADNPLFETRAQYSNLAMVAKSTTTNLVSYTHYVDTSLTGTTITMTPVASGKRISNVVANINSVPGVFHSPKFVMTTNNETVGFEPLYAGYFFKVEREHLH